MFDFLLDLDIFSLIAIGVFFFGCDVIIFSELIRYHKKKNRG